ncbi:MAG: hypothetical protein AAFN11_19030 [Chloroflexota bacterium]
MIFQHTLEQVLQQSKTQTRRVIHPNEEAVRGRYNRIVSVVHNGRLKWEVGRTYAVQPARGASQVARINLTAINSEYITRINTKDAIAEGFESRQAFLSTWRKIHGDDSFSLRVWVLRFELESYLAPDFIPQEMNATEQAFAYAAG